MSQLSESIDKIIIQQYSTIKKFGELAQLSLLFDSGFLQKLINTIAKKAISQSQRQYEISLCWIDKSPLADFTRLKIHDHNQHLITKKVELGDLALFFIKENTNGIPSENYAVIMQAKVSKNNALPNVPIGTEKIPNNSTAKELTLLSNWPTFNLFKASRSKTPLLKDISLSSSNKGQYGWYMVCPNQPFSKSNWRSPWMCSPAILGHACKITIGELLESLIHRLSSATSTQLVGEAFKNINITYSDWDKVCNKILELCRSSKLPKQYFSSTINRKVFAKTSAKVLSKQSRKRHNKCRNIYCSVCYLSIADYIRESITNTNTSYQSARGFPILIISSRPYID